jgi:LEA14-like dessication related protein
MKIYKLVLILSITLLSCDAIEELNLVGQPEVKVRGFDNGEIMLDLLLEINNPNSRSFKVKKANFSIFLNGASVGDSHLENTIKINANSSKTYAFPMKVKLKAEELSLSSLLGTLFNKQMRLKIEGDIKAGSLFITQKFPVLWEENISL